MEGSEIQRARENSPPPRVTTRLDLPAQTIAKVILTLVIIWLLTKLWSILLVLFVALLLAAALDPLVRRLQRHGLGRTASVAVVFLVGITSAVLIGLLVIPPLIQEGSALTKDLPDYVDKGRRILQRNPDLYDRLQRAATGASSNPSNLANRFVTVGAGLVSGISNTVIAIVMSIYVLIDGPRIYGWTVRYLPTRHREKLDRAIPEISHVVSGYVAGQLLTSLLFGIYSFALLSILGVPQALFLALLAAFADAIPIAGVFLATLPTVLLALTVSIPAAVVVAVGYVVYQQIENYLIVPRVYRSTLQISSFAVLITVLIGAKLLGIIGVLIALPIAAAIPVIERIWIGEPHTLHPFDLSDAAMTSDSPVTDAPA